jgi:UPF0271 protein
MNKKVLVLDSSAFIAGFDLSLINLQAYSPPLVIEELPREGPIALRAKTLQEIRKLNVKKPNEKSERKVCEIAVKVGDKSVLSKADLQLLALAFELKNEGFKPIILTDDYAIQNVAYFLQLDFSSIATFGISKPLKWIVYCPACFKKYNEDEKTVCDVCGAKLKRKAEGN